ncbi:MAG: tRNA guanosine(34) transglycosylase Tgt [Candidatus Moranbacteria bacterium]|nr:tRNA guanosine(34) transglycosylase Tgt [Candidatus Moranbacteria bacterium]
MSQWQECKQTGLSRVGIIQTRKGSLRTPFFMPDATRASVRGLTTTDLEQVGVEALVVNTYHLMLQPGEALIKAAGGIHTFMDWPHPVLSDSGGYQVYSLIHKNPDLGRITEEGAEFRSVIDGSKHLITPERSIQIQFDLGVDMMVVLDDPRPNDASEGDIVAAVDRTLRWAKRCREEYDRQVVARALTDETRPLLFGVVQGGMMIVERKRCAEGLVSIGFDGYGLGGRHVDMEGNFLGEVMAALASFLPDESIRFALGVGTPEDIVRLHAVGWDMFDCVIPTREGRHGRLFLQKKSLQNTDVKTQIPNKTQKQNFQSLLWDEEDPFYETININNEQFIKDFTPVDPACDCTLCTKYTRSHLRHLFRVGEPLALRLASEHNLRFYIRLMERLRVVGGVKM